jgi:hypothetical protein
MRPKGDLSLSEKCAGHEALGDHAALSSNKMNVRFSGSGLGASVCADEASPMKKMKAYASFDDYLEDQTPKNQAIIHALRKFVKRVEPGLNEAVKWGNGCWVGKNGPVAYVYSDTGYVQFGFFNGSSLKDPRGLLEGKGRYVRHIKVRDRSEIDARPFAALLRQAAGSR